MTPYDGNLACKSTYHASTKVVVANGAHLCLSHVGNYYLHSTIKPLRLNSIYHVPNLK